ncbi:MAG TPA: hypothetical protein VFH94_27275, partial [Streptomyces sp.]|nr:hypothetical protein [Streptomyces sp.]
SLGAPALGWAAGVLSVQAAMVIGGVFSTLGAVCFLPALRRERTLAARLPISSADGSTHGGPHGEPARQA